MRLQHCAVRASDIIAVPCETRLLSHFHSKWPLCSWAETALLVGSLNPVDTLQSPAKGQVTAPQSSYNVASTSAREKEDQTD